MIKRPPLRYYGGKFVIADWIISYFPKHKSYAETCGGGASVLLKKPRSKAEVYNDLDSNVFNFFKVLRDRSGELLEKLKLTPWSRDEFELCLEQADDPLEKARRFFVVHKMGFKRSLNTTKGQIKFTCHNPRSHTGNIYEDYLKKIVNRLRGVQFENRDIYNILDRFDTEDTLFYIDPPYLHETRSSNNTYLHEWERKDHVKLLCEIQKLKGFIVLSGYNNSLYEELGWRRYDKEAPTNKGNRIESIWLSPNIKEKVEQVKLF